MVCGYWIYKRKFAFRSIENRIIAFKINILIWCCSPSAISGHSDSTVVSLIFSFLVKRYLNISRKRIVTVNRRNVRSYVYFICGFSGRTSSTIFHYPHHRLKKRKKSLFIVPERVIYRRWVLLIFISVFINSLCLFAWNFAIDFEQTSRWPGDLQL